MRMVVIFAPVTDVTWYSSKEENTPAGKEKEKIMLTHLN